MPRLTTSKNKAIMDIAQALKKVFKNYTQTTRKYAWKKVSGTKGQAEVQRLAVNPDRSLAPFEKLAFKEWVTEETLPTSPSS